MFCWGSPAMAVTWWIPRMSGKVNVSRRTRPRRGDLELLGLPVVAEKARPYRPPYQQVPNRRLVPLLFEVPLYPVLRESLRHLPSGGAPPLRGELDRCAERLDRR